MGCFLGENPEMAPAVFRLIFLLSSFSKDAAAAAKSIQLCPALCDPIDGSPPGSPIPVILQARILEEMGVNNATCLGM